MNLFFLIADDSDGAGSYLKAVLPLVPEDKLEVFDGFPEFSDRLRRPRDLSSALLVLGPSREDLKKLALLKRYLKDAKVLLVLGAEDPETISLAHKILPTYISDVESGPSGVVSVLNRIIRDSGAPWTRA